MKKIKFGALALSALMAFTGAATAAELFPTQSFTGLTVGNLVGQGGWDQTGTTSTNPVQVTVGDLTHPNLPAEVGDRSITIVGGGQDVGLSFALQPTAAGTTLYYSFLMRVTDTPSFNNETYFAHFTEGTASSGTGFRGRVFMKHVPGPPEGFTLGIDISSGDIPVNVPGTFSFDDTIFVAVKLTYNAGTTDDEAAIFVNKVQATEPTPDAVEGSATQPVDFAAIGRFGFRQDADSDTPSIQIDQVRAGTTWADVVPFTSSVADWTMY